MQVEKEGITMTVTPTERHDVINGVHVFNAHLLHEDILTVIKYALVHAPDENLQAIFVNTTGPRSAVGKYDYHTRSFCISLPQIMEDAIDTISVEKDMGMSISGLIWFGLVYTIFHELHHNVALHLELGTTKAFTDLDEDWFEQEESDAIDYAEEMVEEAIIRCNAEVPKDILDIPWIGERVMDFLVKSLDDPEFVRSVKERLDKGIVFEGKGDIYDSMVEYFKANTKHPEKYETENKGAAIEMVAENPNLFDKKILPGEQRELFQNNLGGGVSEQLSEGETEDITRLTKEMISQKGEKPMFDDVHDHLPPEATMTPEACGTASEDDPFGATTPADVAYQVIEKDIKSGYHGIPGSSPEAVAEFKSRTEPLPGVSNEVTDLVQRQMPSKDPFAANFTPPATTGGGDFPDGRKVKETLHWVSAANAFNTTVHAQYKKTDGTVGKSTHTPTPEAVEAAKQIMMGLYSRLHQHMFTNDVYQPLMLTDAEKTLGLVIGYNTWNGSQVICVDAKQTGAIAGLKYKNGTLPAYDLIINWGGQAKRIKLIAQNPNTASASAARARAGSKITQILEVVDNNGKGEYRSFIENGVYTRY